MADNHQQESLDMDESQYLPPPLRELRRRWELASVLNFLSVFEPLIGKELKMSAEEIEDALINPNDLLSKLHISLLKGIRPFSKKLHDPDVWVTILCRRLAEWWPLVAEGKVPLTEAKGEEISRYKELDPTVRLLMLKALCEIRTQQHDLVSYINDALKEGGQVSQFRKDTIAQDKNGASYWYDGNSVIGHRLYREVNKVMKQKLRGKKCLHLQETSSEWEILATNLEEFRKITEKFSSCQVGAEAAVHETIETEVIPVLEKMQKKKERDLKRQKLVESRLSGCHSYAAGVTRSCRTRKPVKYTFDDYDRTIDEAIKSPRKRKPGEVERNDSMHHRLRKRGSASNGFSQSGGHSEEEAVVSTHEDELNDQQGEGDNNHEENDQQGEGSENNGETDSQIEDSETDRQSENDCKTDLQIEGSDTDKDTSWTDSGGKSDNEIVSDSESDSSDNELKNVKTNGANHIKLLSQGQNDDVATGLQVKKSSDCNASQNLRKVRNPEAKNRYRQRPIVNSAFDDDVVVPDSENESEEDPSEAADSSEEDPSEAADSSEEDPSEAADSSEEDPYEAADSEDEISR
ncbi:hypothetical protein SOVF_196910 [Spinacia oleracea]|nr:hypothetical protein SOVF_196910 [Spinacia oleracea]